MSLRNIALSTFWQIASQALMAVLSALSVKFVAIGLSKDLAGAYNSSYGYLQLFAILADFGLYAVSVREVSDARERENTLGGLLVLRCIAMVLSLGAGVLIAWNIPAWDGEPIRIGIAIAALVPFFTLAAGVLRTVFQVHFAMHFVFIAEVLQRVLTTGLMGGIILFGVRASSSETVFQLFLWIGALGALLLLLLSICFSLRFMAVRPCFDVTRLQKLFLRALPYGVAFLCIALYRQLDVTLIALFRPDYAVLNAEYGFALRIAEMTFLIPTFLLNSTLPLLSERRGKGADVSSMLGKLLLTVLALSAFSALCSLTLARPLMLVLTTQAYLSSAGHVGADTALRFLSGPILLNGIVLYCFYALLAEHRWKPLVSRMCLAAVLSLGSNWILIPSFGYMGAIATSTMVHAYLAAALLPITLRVLPVRFPLIRKRI